MVCGQDELSETSETKATVGMEQLSVASFNILISGLGISLMH